MITLITVTCPVYYLYAYFNCYENNNKIVYENCQFLFIIFEIKYQYNCKIIYCGFVSPYTGINHNIPKQCTVNNADVDLTI